MSERGYICLDRGALDHPFFKRVEHSEFEAWVWLLMEASWKPRVRRIGEFLVPLQRGQLVASIRHLSDVWSWSKGKVERFIQRLKTETMIGTHVETGITVITICNYDEYQTGLQDGGTSIGTPTGTGAGHPRGQGRDTHGDNTETIKQSTIEEVRAAKAALPNPEADLFRRVKEICGASSGGLAKRLLEAKQGNVPLARAAAEQASTKENPREYLGAIIRSKAGGDDRTAGRAF